MALGHSTFLGAAGLSLVVFMSACGSDADAPNEPMSYVYTGGTAGMVGAGGAAGSATVNPPVDPSLAIGQRVPFPTTEWTVKTPEEMGMSSAILDGARQYAFDFDGNNDGIPDMNTQGVVVVRGGAIVAEWYAPGKDAGSWATSWSAAKSFASTLVGIAIDEGLISGVDVSMSRFFPEWGGTPKQAITLESVLWMQSGLDFEENYSDLNAEIVQISATGDALSFARSLGVRAPPNTEWYYSSGDTELLGGVIEAATGMNATEYARQKLFGPIGMNPVDWWVDGANHTFTYCCLDAPTRQFAKFGLLLLRDGNWDGRQIVSAEWARQATRHLATHNEGYAYQWWTQGSMKSVPYIDMYSAQGLDEQRIFVIPSLDLVVAKNTTYGKPAGPAIAPTGWLAQFAPRGLTLSTQGTGTVGPFIWEDAAFLAPIINSIAGAQHYDFTPTKLGTSPNDPVLCRQEAQEFGRYCEEIHGCTCDYCAVSLLDCEKSVGCKEIVKCALETGCRNISCAAPEMCLDVINQYGGTSTGNAEVSLALALSECVENACPAPTTCPL